MTRIEDLQTPALLIRLDRVRANLHLMKELLGGELGRWRPHVKTAKIPQVLDLLLDAGVRSFKCATTREAEVLLARAAVPVDLLVAMAHRGANLRRLAELARRWPIHRLSLLTEDPDHAAEVRRRAPEIGLFLDLDPEFGRSGAPLGDWPRLHATARAMGAAGRGLHFYEGQVREAAPAAREERCRRLYPKLLVIAERLEQAGLPLPELITSGTPTFLAALRYPGFADLRHQVSPGTVVYWDTTSAGFGIAGFRYAATVLSTVTSVPAPDRVTCDAGSKALDAACGDPCAEVVGWPGLRAARPNEEHLPLLREAGAVPAAGFLLELVPRHVCPTVNLADAAALLDGERVLEIVPVAARGHELGVFPATSGQSAGGER